MTLEQNGHVGKFIVKKQLTKVTPNHRATRVQDETLKKIYIDGVAKAEAAATIDKDKEVNVHRAKDG